MEFVEAGKLAAGWGVEHLLPAFAWFAGLFS